MKRLGFLLVAVGMLSWIATANSDVASDAINISPAAAQQAAIPAIPAGQPACGTGSAGALEACPGSPASVTFISAMSADRAAGTYSDLGGVP